MSKKLGINIVILGKTGVGKSSFANYIFNENIFRKGYGKPITTWQENFQTHSTEFDSYKLNIFDSVGIEANNLEYWKSQLEDFISTRNDYESTHPSEWIHGVFYLFNAAAARIEQTEIEIIKAILKKGIPIQVVITHADSANEEKIKGLRERLYEDFSSNLAITEVCSENVKRRNGESLQRGKEDVLNVFLGSLRKKIKPQLCLYTLTQIYQTIDNCHKDLSNKIQKSEISFWNIVKTSIEDGNLDDLLGFNWDDMNFDDYGFQIEALEHFIQNNIPPNSSLKDKDAIDEIYTLGEELETFTTQQCEVMQQKFESIETAFDSGSLGEKLAAVGTVTTIAFDIKGFFLDTINELFLSIKKTILKHKSTYVKQLRKSAYY